MDERPIKKFRWPENRRISPGKKSAGKKEKTLAGRAQVTIPSMFFF